MKIKKILGKYPVIAGIAKRLFPRIVPNWYNTGGGGLWLKIKNLNFLENFYEISQNLFLSLLFSLSLGLSFCGHHQILVLLGSLS